MTAKALKKSRNKELEEHRAFSYFKPKYISGFLSIIAIFFLTVYPNLLYGSSNHSGWSPKNSATIVLASNPYSISSDWYDAMIWMKNNTPEPFGNDSFYYSLYKAPANGQPYAYPDTAYGVMSWWDFGHWITCIAHRIPNANPFQSGVGGPGANGSVIPGACTFFVAQDEQAGSQILDALGSRYIVINYETAVIDQYSIFPVIPTWAGQSETNYYDVWYQQTSSGGLSPFEVFYPAYYQSMVVRLYNFGAQAVVPNNSTFVIKYTWANATNGQQFKLLTGVANNGSAFATYEEAAQFVKDHAGYQIVGVDPRMSPIPLDALKGYKLIYSSPSVRPPVGGRNVSEVEIFEYTDYKH
jgi:dolichyl-diphosphooligosaccharide--protein glycosyltransferase